MDQTAPVLSGVSEKARKTAVRYLGANAFGYEAKRSGKTKWQGEDRKVKEFLADLPAGSSILDIPCGTGRFFPYYRERNFRAVAMDISPDMLAEARKRASENITIQTGSIFDISAGPFDAVLCIRFLNLIEADDVKLALASMQSVAAARVVFTLRVKQRNPTGHYHHPYPISLVKGALLPKWKINRNEPIHEADYRLIELVK